MVFCEGEASEPDYINGMKRLPEVRTNLAIEVEIAADQGVPMTLVKRASDRLRDDEVDECWCVFDVEWPQHHPNLFDARKLALDHGVKLAVSNPCFELWLMLHIKDCSAFLTTEEAERRSRRLDGRAGKRIDADWYVERRGVASARATALAARHENNGTPFPDDNPSSSMYDLIAAIVP